MMWKIALDQSDILIVAEYPIVRAGIGILLRQVEGGHVTLHEAGDAKAGLHAIEACDSLDLAVIDLALPATQSNDLMRGLRQQSSHIPVIGLVDTANRQTLLEAYDFGAQGVLMKSCPLPEFRAAMLVVMSGGTYIPPEALQYLRIDDQIAFPDQHPAVVTSMQDAWHALSARQQDVLALMVQGKSNKEICKELRMAQGTVKNHVATILKRLNVRNRAHAVSVITQEAVQHTGHFGTVAQETCLEKVARY